MSAISAACTGKLSISSQLTGEFERPIITTVNCSEVDKKQKHELFNELTHKDLEEIKTNIKTLN